MALKLRKETKPNVPGYTILNKLDEGGTSLVYRGVHEATGLPVAIKAIKKSVTRDGELMQRFEQEFRSAQDLHHPNIVKVLDFGKSEQGAYLVMEFVEGCNLLDRIDHDGALSVTEAVAIISQIAQALHYAHSRGIIHRDVKPQNVLLRRDGRAQLTDFGLVKNLMGDLMLTGPMSLLGTPHFMAPEQYEDARKVDARSDVYSLAATLYCAVTGELPFKADTPLEVLGKQAVNDLIAPRQHVPSLGEALERVILEGMDPDPARRPESVLEFVRRLRHAGSAAKGVPVEAAEGAERRSAVRYRRVLGTACKKKSCLHEDDQDALPWPAVVQDISRGGVGLLLSRRFEPGTVLVLELQAPGTDAARGVDARVTYVRAQPFGHWQVGCAFTEALSEDELQALL